MKIESLKHIDLKLEQESQSKNRLMWLQIVQNPPIHNQACKVPALISPRQGHTQEEVIDRLQKLGAENLQFPADGFISAEISPDSVKNLECLAIVEIKQRYQMRNGQNEQKGCY